MKYDFDLFVIGGGSGGIRAALLASKLGYKVGIAEEQRYGGTCVIRGCVPKKLLVYASCFQENFKIADKFGWSYGKTGFQWSDLIANKDTEIQRLENIYRELLLKNGVQTFLTRARLHSSNKIFLVEQDLVVSARRILIATGGTPNRLFSLKGHEHCITSDEAFNLKELPESIVIYGGGYIAIEFAGIFNSLGVDTTLVCRGKNILRGFDHDLQAALCKAMRYKNIKIMENTIVDEVVKKTDGIRHVKLTSGQTLACNTFMLAVGRIPRTSDLGLEASGIEKDKNGYIKISPYSQTSNPDVWAVGDITNKVQLTPVAIHQAMCFVETEFKNNPVTPDYDMIATAVFSQPEIATIGMGECKAKQKYHEIDVYSTIFRPMKYAFSGHEERMFIKIIVDHCSDRILGIHIMGENAGEMIQLLAISLKMGACKSDFDKTVAVHPTLAEEIVTMYNPSYRIVGGRRM